MNLLDQTKKKMQAVLDHLKAELRSLRTGRANTAMVEGVFVEVYGTRMRLPELASLSTPEARQILISPFDTQNSPAIAKAIESANLNLRPVVDKGVIRIKIPEMDASVRQEMVKQAKQRGEEAKVSIRKVRQDANQEVKKSTQFTEDEKKGKEKKVQELTDEHCKLADKIVQEKEKEILTI